MRTEHLEFLVELANTHSMSLAGKNLHVSHQGISNSITRLENELGVELVNRTKNGVFLTEIGQKYADLATRFLDELAQLKHSADTFEVSDEQGILTIVCVPMFNVMILPNSVAAFCRQYPKYQIIIREMGNKEVVKAIKEERADIGLVMQLRNYSNSIVAPDDISPLKIEKLFSNPIYGLIEKSLPLASRKSVAIKELLQYPLVGYNDPSNIVIEHIVSHPEIYGEPRIMIDSVSVKTSYKAIAEGLAIGILSKHVLNCNKGTIPDNVASIPISDKLRYICGYVMNMEREIPLPVKKFLDILKNNV